jgi:UDP-N-acetylmuramate--alanine ligase
MKTSNGAGIHFIGIGGAGVSGLARIALQSGHSVSGSDTTWNELTDELTSEGATIRLGHDSVHLPDECGLVVISAAIRPDNPEVRAAVSRGLPVIKYAEALGEITRLHTSLCVAGTHGKTTTTAMLAQVMHESGRRPGWLVGGEPASLPAPSAAAKGRHFVAEACEYDRSFLRLHPSAIVLNNIELDHMDVYGNVDGLVQGFIEFARRLPRKGVLFYNADDPLCREVAKRAGVCAVSFGEGADAVWRITNVDAASGFASADVFCRGATVGRMILEVPGRVNAMNALGALAASNWAGVPAPAALASLRNYSGVKRRFEMLGSVGGVPLVEDYAHHPTALRQLLETARATFSQRRIVAIFQAHQYQRILTFFDEFADCLSEADRVLIARTYAAREQNVVPGEPEERLARTLRGFGVDAMAYSDFSSIISDLSMKLQPRDVALFIGAGDINRVAHELLARREFISARLRAIKPSFVLEEVA